MENQVKVFENSEFGKVRVVAKNGEPWFVAADVCRVLEIKNTADALAKLDNDEKMTLDSNEGHSGHRGGAQKMNVVNEPGLYSLVLGSRKPQAKAFKKWIFSEIVPFLKSTNTTTCNKIPATGTAVAESKEFGRLEVIMIDDKPYFPANDCAKMLGYARPYDAVSAHCRYTVKRSTPHPQSSDKTIEKVFIPEGDLYRLIIRSKLPAAEKFERWVFDEVIPSIRKHGGYIAGQEQMDREQLVQAAQAVAERVLSEKDALRLKLFDPDPLEVVNAHKALVEMEVKPLREKIEADAPKVRFAEVATKSPVNIRIREMAKILCDKGFDTGEKRLFALLRSKGVLMDDNLPYQQYIDRGYFVVRESTADLGAFVKLTLTTLVTPRGQVWIANKIAEWMAA